MKQTRMVWVALSIFVGGVCFFPTHVLSQSHEELIEGAKKEGKVV